MFSFLKYKYYLWSCKKQLMISFNGWKKLKNWGYNNFLVYSKSSTIKHYNVKNSKRITTSILHKSILNFVDKIQSVKNEIFIVNV